MRRLLIPIIILCIELFTSCNNQHRYPTELLTIDSICETKPDSAEIYLRRIKDCKAITKEGENQWYIRFLQLKAKVKANKDSYDETEITALIRHYCNDDNKDILANVYYCAGCAYSALGDFPQSIDFFHRALTLVGNNSNDKLKALCYYQLGNKYSLQDLYQEAIVWQKKSLAENYKNKNYLRCIYDYEELAWTAGNLGNIKQSLKYMNNAKKIATNMNDTVNIAEIEGQIAIHYYNLDSIKLAKKHIDKALSRKIRTKEIYPIALSIYAKLGIDNKSKEFCDSIIKKGNIYGKSYAYFWLSKYLIKANKLDSAAIAIDKYKAYSDSTQRIRSSEASAKANALYNYGIREKENIQLKEDNMQKALYLTITLSTIIIGILIFIITYRRIKNQNKQIKERCSVLRDILEKEKQNNETAIKAKENEIRNITTQLLKLKDQDEQNRIKLERELSNKKFDLESISYETKKKSLCDSEFRSTNIYNEISICSREAYNQKFTNWETLEKTIYDVYPSFKNQLEKFAPMNETEFKVCLLIRSGFNALTISKLIFRTQNSVYSICRRLYKKNFGVYAASSEWEKIIKSIY